MPVAPVRRRVPDPRTPEQKRAQLAAARQAAIARKRQGIAAPTRKAKKSRQAASKARARAKAKLAALADLLPTEPVVVPDPDAVLAMGPAIALRRKLQEIGARLRSGPRMGGDVDSASGQAPLPPMALMTIRGVQALSLAVRYLEGGRDRFEQYVQLAVLNGEEAARRFWQVFADLTPVERREVSYDDVCAVADIKPHELMAGVVRHAMVFGQDVGNLIAATLSPAVIAKMGESGLRIDDVRHAEVAQKDRHIFLQSVGFAPAPKAGVSVAVSANAQAAAASAADPSVPSFAKALQAASGARGEVLTAQATQPQLPAAAPSPFLEALRAAADAEDLRVPVAADGAPEPVDAEIVE